MSVKRKLNIITLSFAIISMGLISAMAVRSYRSNQNASVNRLKSEVQLIIASQAPYLIEDFRNQNKQSAMLRSISLIAAYGELDLAIELKDSRGKIWLQQPKSSLDSYKRNRDSISVNILREITLAPERLGSIEVWAKIPKEQIESRNYALYFAALSTSLLFISLLGLWLILEANFINPITKLANYVGSYSGESQFIPPDNLTSEIAQLGQFCKQMVFRLNKAMVEKASAQARISIARQVAHDIRSPIGALDIVINLATKIPEDHKSLALQSISRIKQIASDLLSNKPSAHPMSIEELGLVIQSVAYEKEFTLGSRCKIETQLPTEPINFIAEPTSLGRIFSNLFNNSIEASQGQNTKIKVQATTNQKQLQITVADDGPGLSEATIKILSETDFSSKKEGHGLGLSSARKHIESWGGTFQIKNGETGAIVLITLLLES